MPPIHPKSIEPHPRLAARLLLSACLTILPACGPGRPAEPAPGPGPSEAEPERPTAPPLRFHAQELPFRYDTGDTGAKWPVEVTGGAVAIFDADGDGDLDLFFPQGGPLLAGSSPNPPADCLLRNDGGLNFTDVSAEVGLTPKGYGQGVAAADYDGDGDTDLYVTRYGANTLWRNDAGRFVDATAEAAVGCDLWSLGAAFFDGDGDGDLDLFVANYFGFNPADAPFARTPEGDPEYGPPSGFPGQPDVLYRNEGDGTFVDITEASGVAGAGRGMGVLAADLDDDGRLDLLVANDAEANAAWINQENGTFVDEATLMGLDLNGEGRAEANMGIALGDADGDGLADVAISHYVGEHDTLWRARAIPDGGRIYADFTYAAGLGSGSMAMTGWGVAFADFDRDGHLDFLVVNGHIRPEVGQKFDVANPPLLWHNRGDGRFVDVTDSAGPYFQARHQGRGLAVGDLDGDGDLDAVVVHRDEPAVLLRNDSPAPGHWLILDLQGNPPNRDAIGATVEVEAGGRTQVGVVKGGGGYLSADDRRLHFGLGPADRVDHIKVRWPSGRVEEQTGLDADRVVEWAESGSGIPDPTVVK